MWRENTRGKPTPPSARQGLNTAMNQETYHVCSFPVILTPCYILTVFPPVSSVFISSFIAPKSVTLPCYSFGSSFYSDQQKLQICKYPVGYAANSCFFFIFRFYYCTESPFIQPLSVLQALNLQTSFLDPLVLFSPQVLVVYLQPHPSIHSSWPRALPSLQILHSPVHTASRASGYS